MFSMAKDIPEISIEKYAATRLEKFEFEWTNLKKQDLWVPTSFAAPSSLSSSLRSTSSIFKSDIFAKVTADSSWKFYLQLLFMQQTKLTVHLTSCPKGEIVASLKFVVKKKDRVITEVGDGPSFYHFSPLSRFYELESISLDDIDDDVKICGTMYTRTHTDGDSVEDLWQNLPIYHRNENRRDLLSFLQNGGDVFRDVVLKVDGKEIKCHKCVLCFRSSYFSSRSDFIHEYTEITDYDYETIKLMIDFTYTSQCPKLELDSAMNLLSAAEKFQIPELKDTCERYLIADMDVSNVLKILLHADKHSVINVKKHAMDYVCKNLTAFKKPEQYDPLMARPDLLRDLLLAKAKHLDFNFSSFS